MSPNSSLELIATTSLVSPVAILAITPATLVVPPVIWRAT